MLDPESFRRFMDDKFAVPRSLQEETERVAYTETRLRIANYEAKILHLCKSVGCADCGVAVGIENGGILYERASQSLTDMNEPFAIVCKRCQNLRDYEMFDPSI